MTLSFNRLERIFILMFYNVVVKIPLALTLQEQQRLPIPLTNTVQIDLAPHYAGAAADRDNIQHY